MKKQCQHCKKEFSRADKKYRMSNKAWDNMLFCSQFCNTKLINKGRKITDEHRKNLIKSHIGKIHSGSFKKGRVMKGELAGNWQGGITKLNFQIRNSFKYRQWRCDVFERDNYTCQECGYTGYIESHHIKPFALILKENDIKSLEEAINSEELWNINNGLTLCKPCHKLTDSYLKKNYGK